MRLAVAPEKPTTFTLRIRIPGWAEGRPVPSDLYVYDDPTTPAWTLRVDGSEVKASVEHGYASITREWRSDDVVELDLPMPTHAVRGNEKIAATRDRVAFERGPVVYGVEDVDWAKSLDAVSIPASAKLVAEARPKLLGGVTVLTIDGAESAGKPAPKFTAIPYFAWNNRGLAPMAVWLKRTP